MKQHPRKYNSQQLKAIEHPPGPVLILAGAGTGKTTTIVGRMAHLIRHYEALPETILVLTFTVKAAEQLKSRLVEEIGPPGGEITAVNFHSFAQSLLFDFLKELGYPRKPSILLDSDIHFLLKEKFDELPVLKSERFKREPVFAIQTLKSLFDRFRDELLNLDDLAAKRHHLLEESDREVNENQRERLLQLSDAAAVFPLYQEWKKQRGAIDFGDMITDLWQLVQPQSPHCSVLQNQYRHIFVDEFQDNNYALSRIVEQLAKPNDSITVVGDDDQCIYSFRGANNTNIHQFENVFGQHSRYLKTELMTNFRSTQAILDQANRIIEENKERMPKGRLVSNDGMGDRPSLIVGPKERQLDWICDTIADRIKTIEHSPVAVLTRTQRQAETVISHLQQRLIPVCRGPVRLFDQPVAKDIISLLQVILKLPLKNIALIRLLKIRFPNAVVQKSLAAAGGAGPNRDLLSMLLNGVDDENRKLVDYCRQLNRLRRDCPGNAADLLRELVIFGKFYQNADKKVSLRNRLIKDSLNRLFEISSDYISRYDSHDLQQYGRFLETLFNINDQYLAVRDTWDKNKAVSVMTVHQSKGMEFHTVILPFLSSASFPSNYRPDNLSTSLPLEWRQWQRTGLTEKEKHVAEERRIMYVAVTRAEKQLILMTTPKRQSLFLKPLDKSRLNEEILKMEPAQSTQDPGIISRLKNQLVAEAAAGNFAAARDILKLLEVTDQFYRGEPVVWPETELSKMVQNSLPETDPDVTVSENLILSATQIEKYTTCPLKYRYSEVERIPEKPVKPYFSLGRVIHKVLEIYCLQEDQSQIALLDLLKSHWDSEGYAFEQEEEQYIADAEKMLINFYRYIQSRRMEVFETEHRFNMPLDNCLIKGVCDRIDVDGDGEITIIDYKTSRRKPSQREFEKNIQLGIYAMYVAQSDFERDGRRLGRLPKSLTMLYLRHEEPELETAVVPERLAETRLFIEETAQKIKQKEFPAKPGFHCRYCDYRDLICREYNGLKQ